MAESIQFHIPRWLANQANGTSEKHGGHMHFSVENDVRVLGVVYHEDVQSMESGGIEHVSWFHTGLCCQLVPGSSVAVRSVVSQNL